MSIEQSLSSYQWLEYMAMYSHQAALNPTFAKSFLQDINRALKCNTYLTGQFLTIADIAAYYVLYSLLERLSINERESYLHVCRWSKHIQAQPKCVCHQTPSTIEYIDFIIFSTSCSLINIILIYCIS
ncbi:hypothetical protein ACJJTC_011725 [Scirpophaga incertulas]